MARRIDADTKAAEAITRSQNIVLAASVEIAPDTGERISRLRALRFGAGYFGFSLLWMIGLQIVAVVLLPQRLKDIGDAEPVSLMGTISAITAMVSLASNLIFGNLSDRTRSRFGRRTPWIVWGSVVGGASLTAVGFLDTPVAITVAYCISMVGLNMMLAPGMAILADRVPPSVRGTVSAFYGGGLAAGAPLGAMIGAAFISYAIPGFILGGALLVLGAVAGVIIWPRERSNAEVAKAPVDFASIIRSFRPPRNAPDFWLAFAAQLCMFTSYQMVMAYQLYIVQDHAGQTVEESAVTIAGMSMILLVVSVIGSSISGPISDRLRRRKLPVLVSCTLFAIGISMPWIFPTTTGMYLMAGIAGFGYGLYTSVDQALKVDVLPNDKEAGKDLGILNLSTTAGQTVGPLITSALVAATGNYNLVFPVAIIATLAGATCVMRIRCVR